MSSEQDATANDDQLTARISAAFDGNDNVTVMPYASGGVFVQLAEDAYGEPHAWRVSPSKGRVSVEEIVNEEILDIADFIDQIRSMQSTESV